MEIFRDTCFDFLGRKWWFILPSLLLMFAGLVSLAAHGGPRYGIDFTGGAVMDVRWQGPPPIERIRAAVSSHLKDVSVVAAHDRSGSNDVLVSAECPEGTDLTGLRETIAQSLATVDAGYTFRSFEAIGPQIGADLRRQALGAAGGATAGMLLYLAWRFRTAYGLAAVIAMVHDALITVGLLSLLHQDITITVVAALLTLIGYSMNDTIVVFDRIRENRRRNEREPFAQTINRSINQTLSRTILTSGLTLAAALSLLLLGGPVLRGFSLTLVIGIVVGTFSSIFIASPILLAWEQRRTRWNSGPVPLPVGGAR
jgi:preprotein translocase subunit SecF